MRKEYQKCIERIVIEPNQWADRGGNPYQVSIYFKPKVFRYCPRFSELRAILLRLISLYGGEYVNKMMGMEIKIKVREDDKEKDV